jgi:hypothetical protein
MCHLYFPSLRCPYPLGEFFGVGTSLVDSPQSDAEGIQEFPCRDIGGIWWGSGGGGSGRFLVLLVFYGLFRQRSSFPRGLAAVFVVFRVDEESAAGAYAFSAVPVLAGLSWV